MPTKCIGSDGELRIAGNGFQIVGAEIRNVRSTRAKFKVVSWNRVIEKKRKIAEFMWVHNVVTDRTGKVAGQCAMPRWPV